MPPPSLRAMCIEETCNFLEMGVWENCEDNPFSFLPPSVVEDLLSCMLPAGSRSIESRIVHSRLLLTSGRLRRFEVIRFDDLDDPYLDQLFHMLSRGCQNLRTLSVLGYHAPSQVRIHPELLQNCIRLEELSSAVCFDPYHLKNCKKLRSLKLYLEYEATMKFFSFITPDRLQHLASLQVFAFSDTIYPETADDKERLLSATVNILDICPNLSSVGLLDSLKAINKIHCRDGRTLKTARHFKLRSCFWENENDATPKEFCDAIRVAALSCPLLQILDIQARDAGCLKHLMVLRSLNSLDIHFDLCEDDYEQEFYSLLNEIGTQLQSLKVFGPLGKTPLSVDLICGVCSNLSELELFCDITMSESISKCENLVHLKRLSITHCDRQSLFFLLSNSVHLERLFLYNGKDLDDAVLHKIIRKDAFAQLVQAVILQSFLSKSGWTEFVQIPVMLKHLHLSSSAFTDRLEAKRCLKRANPSLLSVICVK